MELQEAQRILKDISYKPNFSMSVTGSSTMYETAGLRISAMLEDSYNSGNIIPIVAFPSLPLYVIEDLDDLLHCVHDHICAFERHETDEWFKYKGKPVFDPHGPR